MSGLARFIAAAAFTTACLGGESGSETTALPGVDAGSSGGGAGGAPSNDGGSPSGNGGEPSNNGGEPSNNGGSPSNNGGEPSNNGGEPSNNGGEPSNNGGEPSNNGGEPANNGGEPGTGGVEPVDCGDGWSPEERHWSLPFPLDARSALGSDAHVVFDLTADGIVDFVVYAPHILPEPDPRVGQAYWLVYPGGPDGFAAQPRRYALPYSLVDAGEGPVFSGRGFTLMDLTGDGRTDFVVHHPEWHPDADPRIGRAYWLLYPGGADGFASEPERFLLPFSLREDDDASQLATNAHVIMNLDGDRLPDLIVHRPGEEPEDEPRLGRAFWHLYRNDGGGFGPEPVRFTLPFDLTNQVGDRSQPSTQAHLLTSLGGPEDGFRIDFLLTAAEERFPPDPRLGQAYWQVFRNEGDGFAESPENFGLPFPLRDAPGAALGGYASWVHNVFDLGGDWRPDLVVYRPGLSPDEDARLGRNHWLVYENTGDAFASEPVRWRLPVPLVIDGDDSHAAPATQGHGILALADPCPALIFYHDDELPEPDPRIGRAYWTYFGR